jgi:hypothetical protein
MRKLVIFLVVLVALFSIIRDFPAAIMTEYPAVQASANIFSQ